MRSVTNILHCVAFPNFGNVSCLSCFSCFLERKRKIWKISSIRLALIDAMVGAMIDTMVDVSG